MSQKKKKQHKDDIDALKAKILNFKNMLKDANNTIVSLNAAINQLNNDISNNNNRISQIDIFLQQNSPDKNQLEQQL